MLELQKQKDIHVYKYLKYKSLTLMDKK